MTDGFVSGFASIVGRPNAGKSTLLNQLVRAKVAITSPRPQTTRNAVRGVLTTPHAQVVFVDTPGLHKPRTLLGERLNAVVRRALADVDAVVLVLDASQEIGRGDAFVAGALASVDVPVIAVLNKADLCDRVTIAGRAADVRELGFEHPLVVSARTGRGVRDVERAVTAAMPPGPAYYPGDMRADVPVRRQIAELVREQVLALTREEVPHSIAVAVEDVTPAANGRTEVDVVIYVERPSQKGIVIGAGGATLREAGTRARAGIEALLGGRVHLRVRVKVERDWQRRAAMIERFGYAN